MRDQVAAAARAGVRAVAINSANQLEWDNVREQLAADQVDVLLVSPERLTNPSFRENQLPELIRRTGLLVIDEAHCISDWGTISVPTIGASPILSSNCLGVFPCWLPRPQQTPGWSMTSKSSSAPEC